MMPFLDRTCSQGKDLGAVDQLEKVLEEDEDAERCDEEDQIGGFLSAEGKIDKPVNTYTNGTSRNGGKKKARMGSRPSEIVRV